MWPTHKIPRRFLVAFSLGFTATILVAAPARAAGPDAAAIESLAGPWEISQRDTPRRCGLMLRTDKADTAYSITLPAGCRRSMRPLLDVLTWTLTDDRQLAFNKKGGAAALKFAPDEAGKLIAKGPDGEIFELISTGRQTFNPPAPVVPPPAPAAAPAGFSAPRPPAAAPPPPPPDPASETPVAHYPGRINDLGGRYVILRPGAPGGKDVGCMLTLDDKSRGPGGNRAQLAPACKDQGIVIFEPVGWRFDRGRLILTARKGHSATFDYHADGAWWKDPKEGGKPLGVRHM